MATLKTIDAMRRRWSHVNNKRYPNWDMKLCPSNLESNPFWDPKIAGINIYVSKTSIFRWNPWFGRRIWNPVISSSNHRLDLFQVVTGSTTPLHLYIANCSASCQLGFPIYWVYLNNLFHYGHNELVLIKNWRPLTLLNCDYKIASKAIASRIKTFLPKLISDDQTGFLKGRCISENIRLLDSVIKYAEGRNILGLLLFIDFEKAFDTLAWPCISKTLQHFGFGPSLLNWIELFYCNIAILKAGPWKS